LQNKRLQNEEALRFVFTSNFGIEKHLETLFDSIFIIENDAVALEAWLELKVVSDEKEGG